MGRGVGWVWGAWCGWGRGAAGGGVVWCVGGVGWFVVLGEMIYTPSTCGYGDSVWHGWLGRDNTVGGGRGFSSLCICHLSQCLSPFQKGRSVEGTFFRFRVWHGFRP